MRSLKKKNPNCCSGCLLSSYFVPVVVMVPWYLITCSILTIFLCMDVVIRVVQVRERDTLWVQLESKSVEFQSCSLSHSRSIHSIRVLDRAGSWALHPAPPAEAAGSRCLSSYCCPLALAFTDATWRQNLNPAGLIQHVGVWTVRLTPSLLILSTRSH